MAENKNHHFVPQFYLRIFSSNKKGINLLNLKRGKTVHGAPLRSQCSRDYFYGTDIRYEKALGDVEATSAQVLRTLIESRKVFEKRSADFVSVLIYLSLQYFRTGSKVDYLNEMVDGMAKHLLKFKFSAEELAKYEIHMEGMSNFAVQNAFRKYAMLLDMQWLLLEAGPGCEFITCDTPVLFLNNFLPERLAPGNMGIVASGLIVLFPLAPSLTLMLFDSSVYRTHGVSDGNGSSHVIHKRDVDFLNDCQCASADENVYFLSDGLDIEAVFNRAKRLRPTQKAIRSIVVKEDLAERLRERITTRQAAPRLEPQFSFLKAKKGAVKWREAFLKPAGDKPSVIRHPSLHNALKEYEKFQDSGIQVPSILEFVFVREAHSGRKWF